MNGADTAFILAAAGLVLLMTPGLALFYAGMVRSKNVLGTIMQSLVLISLISLEWVYIGYSMSFGPDINGVIGDLSWWALRGVGTAPSDTYATTIPHVVFMVYQCMFAVITPALIAGAFADKAIVTPFPQRDLHLHAEQPIPMQVVPIGEGPLGTPRSRSQSPPEGKPREMP